MSSELIQVPMGLTTEGLVARRYLARIVDSTVIVVLGAVAISLMGPLRSQSGRVSNIFLIMFTLLVLWIGYGALLESSPWQATLGKRLMGLRVYDSQGGR